jgi:hypothetical protein
MNIHECGSCADDVNKHGDVQIKRVGRLTPTDGIYVQRNYVTECVECVGKGERGMRKKCKWGGKGYA